MMAPPSAAGSLADAQARVAAIQSRLGSLSPKPAPGFAADLEAQSAAARTSTLGTAGTTTPARVTPATEGVQVAAGAAVQSSPAEAPRASGAWADRLPEHGKKWAGAIQSAADKAGIDPALLAALVKHESNFDPSVVSHAGAIGLAQLMPGTARGLGVDPHDPQANLDGGARYLKEQLDRFGSEELALAAYNAGPNRVAQAGGVPRIAETQAYVPRVLATWEQLR
jgi:soluble lytic murein transglycosylase-like protein